MSAAPPVIEYVAAGDDLVRRLRGLIDEAKRSDPLAPVTVVTPSYHSSYFLRRALAPGGLFNVEFARIEDIAERLAAPRLRGEPLDRLLAAQFVYEAASSASDRGPLGRARGHESFHRALHRTLTDLRAAGDSLFPRLPGLGRHYRELASIAAEYRRLSQGYYDRTDVGREATAAIAESGWSLPAMGLLIIVVAQQPAPQYLPVFSALMRVRGARTIAAMTGSEAADKAVRECLSDGAPAPSVQAPQPTETRLVSAPDRHGEVRWVLCNIARLAEEGVRFGDMAVLYGDESYGSRTEEALRLAGIPVSGPDRQPLSEWPEGRFISGLLDARGEFARDAVVDWLASAPVLDPSNGRPVPAARWDAVSRNARVTRGLENWKRALEAYEKRCLAGAEYARIDDEAGEVRGRALKSEAAHTAGLLQFVTGLGDALRPPDTAGWSAMASWLRDLQERYLAAPQDEDAGRRRELTHAILERVSELDSLNLPPPDFDRFEAVIRQELGRASGGHRALGRGVFVAHYREAPGTVFEAVHILGMSEGSFPPQDNPDPLLPDADRARLDPGGAFLPRRDQRRAAHLQQYLAALATGRRRFFLWPRAGPGAARESGPAFWFLDAARALSGDPLLQAGKVSEKCRGQPWFEWLDRYERSLSTLSGFTDRTEYEASHFAGWEQDPLSHPLASRASALGSGIRLQSGRQSPDWTLWDGNLTGAGAFFHGGPDVASPTRYQDWATCPFRFFLAHVLKLQPTERPEELLELTALDRGSLVHRVLEEFVRTRQQRNVSDLTGQEQILSEVATSQFARFESEAPTGHPALWEIEKLHIRRALSEWLRREQDLVHRVGVTRSEVEQAFGLGGKDSPEVTLDLPGGGAMTFRGVIDRMDIAADGRVFVYDYKTGKSDGYGGLERDPVSRGRLLQLPVYSAAARRLLHGQGIKSVSASYWFVFQEGSGEFRPHPGSLDELTSLEAAKRAVAVISEGVKAGCFPANPGGRRRSQGGSGGFENCAYCDFDPVCPSARGWMWERKGASPLLAGYRALNDGLVTTARDEASEGAQ